MGLTLRIIGIASSAFFISACSTTNSIPYKASTSNVIAIQNSVAGTDRKVSVEAFRIAPGINQDLTCRLLGPISVAPGKSIPAYVEEAFQEELFLARAYDPRSAVAISGEIQELQFSSVSPASWDLALRVSSTESPGYTASVSYEFDTSFDAFSACKNVANAFGPAVQALLKQVVNDPRFPQLMGVGQANVILQGVNQ